MYCICTKRNYLAPARNLCELSVFPQRTASCNKSNFRLSILDRLQPLSHLNVGILLVKIGEFSRYALHTPL